MAEIWLPAKGFEDFYEVSDHGRVRSLDRTVWDERGYWKSVRGRVLQQPLSGMYPSVTLHQNPLPPKKIRVHLLVLETFVSMRPTGMHACHYDDNPLNNRLDNLRWDTPLANRMDEIRNGKNRNANKTHCRRGHEYTTVNTIEAHRGNGNRFRTCRECARESSRRYREKKTKMIAAQ